MDDNESLLLRTQKEVKGMIRTLYLLRQYLNYHEKNSHSNMDSKGTANEGSEGNKLHVNMEKGVKGIFFL